jgi:hypothetical protein
MTPDQARWPIQSRLSRPRDYDRDAVGFILGGIDRGQGQGAPDGLIRRPGPQLAFGPEPGTDFSGVGRPAAARVATFTH